MSADKTKCNREHQAIAADIEAIQNELRLSTEKQAQGQSKQTAETIAMGHRIMEMKDLLMQRKLRMESHIARNVFCSQIQTMGAMLKDVEPQTVYIVPMV